MRTHRYPSDLTDEQWPLIERHLPAARRGGRPRSTDLRDVVDAVLYIVRTGCQWHYLPVDFPPKSTVWRYFDRWRRDGTLDAIHDTLRRKVRTAEKPYHPRTTASVTANRSTRPPAASSGAATTPRTSTGGSGTWRSTAWACCWPSW